MTAPDPVLLLLVLLEEEWEMPSKPGCAYRLMALPGFL